MPLVVVWSPSGEATSVRVRTQDLDVESAGDPGTFTVAPGTLRTRTDGPEDERVRVERRIDIDLTGALPGSDMHVDVRNGVDISSVQGGI